MSTNMGVFIGWANVFILEKVTPIHMHYLQQELEEVLGGVDFRGTLDIEKGGLKSDRDLKMSIVIFGGFEYVRKVEGDLKDVKEV
jgi:hypothetical protein